MIKQGHRLVADDVVRITRVASGRIVGTAPEATKYLIEVRGIGIVDVRYLFGVGSAVNEKSIDFIMDLEMFDPTAQYERIGAREKRTELLGVDIPTTVLPVSPGRNIAVVVEVAARNFLLKSLGTTPLAILQNAWKAYLRVKMMKKQDTILVLTLAGRILRARCFRTKGSFRACKRPILRTSRTRQAA